MSNPGDQRIEERNDKKFFRGELYLANGDVYTGCLIGRHPEGRGKYLWADGCMYEGDWSAGQKIGTAKIAWPSGSTYEGEIRDGYMHGHGILTASDGSTYSGRFCNNKYHGYGAKSYANGDLYEGMWKNGVREGEGRYLWSNGNEYYGEWKGGVMTGAGMMKYSHGDRYDGQWRENRVHGGGIYRWADGCVYSGGWSMGLKHGRGDFYPPNANTPDRSIPLRLASSFKDFEEVYSKLETDLSQPDPCSVSNTAVQASATARPNTMDANGRRNNSYDGDKCSSAGSIDSSAIPDTDESEGSVSEGLDEAHCNVVERFYVEGVLVNETVTEHLLPAKLVRRPKQPTDVPRQGETVSKGHRNFDMVICLQLGIKHSIESINEDELGPLLPKDFTPKAKWWLKGLVSSVSQSVEFKMKAYCPMVFRDIRKLFNIDPADYIASICSNGSLREFSSPGKSGSLFYLTDDDRYMIKTVRKTEMKVLLRMLRHYHEHMNLYHKYTLLTKFYGLYSVKFAGQKVRLLVMHNLFSSRLHIHRRYDLKGSSQGRTANKVEIDESTTLKDLDLDFSFHLPSSLRDVLLDQIERDCKFLESEKIMDYSLLLGVHIRPPHSASVLSPDNSSSMFTASGTSVEESHSSGRDSNTSSKGSAAKLGVEMLAKAIRMRTRAEGDSHPEGELFREEHEVILLFGIIDILQEYDISKKLEHAYKSWQYDAGSISAVDPKQYSKRFRDFMGKVFPRDSGEKIFALDTV